MRRLYTIGYSKYDLMSFIRALKAHKADAVADVRSSPFSAFKSEFTREYLQGALQKAGISYVFLGKELGARRAEEECYVDGAASYRLIEKTPMFAKGLERINKGLERYKIVLLCAEADPLKCHRDILVCKNLKRDDIDICHIRFDEGDESNDDAEKRLMRECALDEADLFFGKEEALERAYRTRGKEIAYRRGADNEG